jgi:hypothetical protein
MPQYTLTAPDGKRYIVNAPEGMSQADILSKAKTQLGIEDRASAPASAEDFNTLLDKYFPVSAPEEDVPISRTMSGALGAGWERGKARTGSFFTDILPGLAGSVVGADDYARQQLEEAAAKEQVLQESIPAQFQSLKDIKGIGDIPAFVAETIGEQIPNLLTSLVGGGVGGFAAKRIAQKAGKELLEDYTMKRLGAEVLPTPKDILDQLKTKATADVAEHLAKKEATGQVIGAGAASVGLNTGEIFQNIYEETGEIAPVASIMSGAAAGALDTVLPVKLLKRFRGLDDKAKALALTRIAEKRGVLRGLGTLGVGTLKAGALEGLTEGAQEAISIAAEQFVDDAAPHWGNKEFDRILESSVRGAVAGGPFGTVETGARMLQERGARKEEETRKAAEEAEQQRAKDAETQRQAAIVQEDDELQNQIPAQISALQGGISELQARVDAHESGETDDFSAIEDLKDTEAKLQQLNIRQTYLTAKAQTRAIEDSAEREKTLAEIEKTYTENKKKTEAVATSATPTAANTIEQVLKDAGIDSYGSFVKAANESKAARRKEALDAANTIEDKAARTEAIKNVDLEFPKKNYASTDTLDISSANALLRALRGVGLPEAAKGKPQISTKDFAKKKDDLSLKLKDFVAKNTAAATAPAPAPVVEAAAPVEPAPVVEAAAPVEPAPVVEAAAPVEPAPVVEAAASVEPAPVVEAAAPVEPAPVVEAAAPVEPAPVVAAPAPAPVEPAPVVEAAKNKSFYEELSDSGNRKDALRTLAADMATSSVFKGAPGYYFGISDAERLGKTPEQLADLEAKLGKKRETVAKIVESEEYGKSDKYFGSEKDAVNPKSAGKWGKKFWDTLSPSEKSQIKTMVLGYVHGARTQKEFKKLKLSTGVAPTVASTVQNVESEINRVFKGAKLGDKVVVAASPEAAGVSVTAPEGEVVRGAVVGGKAYLFADNIEQGEEIATLLHEVGAHVGMKDLVGAANYNWLISKIKGWSASKLENVEVISAKAADARAKGDNDELIAYFIEEAIRNGVDPIGVRGTGTTLGNFFKKIIAGFKAALSRLNLQAPDLNAQDIINLAYGAAQKELSQETLDDSVDLAEKLSNTQSIPSNSDKVLNWATDTAYTLAAKLPTPVEKGARTAIDLIERAGGRGKRRALITLTSLNQLGEIAEHYVPGLGDKIDDIYNAVAKRDRLVADYRNGFETVSNDVRDLINKHKNQEEALNEVIGDSTLNEFDPAAAIADGVDPASLDDTQKDIYARFKKLHPDLQGAYVKLRDAYASFADEIERILKEEELLSPGSKILSKLVTKRIRPYFPLYREGDLWLETKMPDGSRSINAFKTSRDREEFKREAERAGATVREFERLRDVIGQDKSALTGEFRELMTAIQNKFGTGEDSKALVDQMYSMYLDLFPTNSIMQQFRKRKGTVGFNKDMLGVFNQIHPRMAMNLAQFKSIKEIDSAYKEARKLITAEPENDMVTSIASSLDSRMKSLKNPTPSNMADRLAAEAGSASYTWFILGNISSAIVNLTQLPMVAYSLLGGKYGFSNTFSAMNFALKLYLNGGKDNNTSFKIPGTDISLTDYSVYGADGKNKLSKEYQELFERAITRGAVRRSIGQDIMEARTRAGADPTSRMAQAMYAGGWVFQNVERFNREVTLLAAYKLAKDKGLNNEAAIKEAIIMTEDAHGVAMSELGPELFQNNLGRVLGVFKRFALSQIYLIGKLMRQVYKGAKGEDAQVAKTAAKQLAGIYGMSFAFAGASGVPLFGALNMILSIALGDDDDPYDLEESMMTNFNDAIVHGPLGKLLGVDFSGRTGYADLIYRPDSKMLSDMGPVAYTLMQIGGAPIGIAKGIEDGYKDIQEGNSWRGVEKMMPSTIRNMLKGIRYASENALTKEGYKLADTSLWDSAMQIAGFTPAEISETYARNSIMKNVERRADARKSRLYRDYYLARKNGDWKEIAEVLDEIDKFRRSRTAELTGIKMSPEDMARSYKLRARREREVIDGIYLHKRAKNNLINEYGKEEE